MTEEKYTNKELARDYFLATSNESAGYENRAMMRGKIRRSTIDIPSFYHEHGSLQELGVKDLGEKTIGLLETILEQCVEAAKRSYALEMNLRHPSHTMPDRSKNRGIGEAIKPKTYRVRH